MQSFTLLPRDRRALLLLAFLRARLSSERARLHVPCNDTMQNNLVEQVAAKEVWFDYVEHHRLGTGSEHTDRLRPLDGHVSCGIDDDCTSSRLTVDDCAALG